MRHAFRVQFLLHFGCKQSIIVYNAELLHTGFQSAAADRVQDQRKLWRVINPVRRSLYPICTSSALETQELGLISDICPKIEARRAVDATPVEHNSLSVVRSPDDSLQVFRAEVDAFKVNFFCGPRCYLQECINVELWLYSGVAVCTIIECEQFESCGSTVGEEAGEIWVCFWNVFYSNSFEAWQPEFRSNTISQQWFLICVVNTDL